MLIFPKVKSDWRHSIDDIQKSYINLIETIIKYQNCVVLCADLAKTSQVLPKSKNLELIQIDTNDTWIRDFGGINVYEGKKLKILNFKFNAWGEKFKYEKDNSLNTRLNNINFFKAPLEDIDFVLEGGSIDSNGEGALLTTENCIFNQNRNPNLSKEQILEKLKSNFGVKEVIALKNGSLIGDDTDSHVDTLARFLDKNTIAYVKCYDTSDEHYTELQKMEKELQNTRFSLVPLPLPSPIFFNEQRLPATYINFVFINDALIVPTYKDKNDKIALEILQRFFPKRDIVGVNASVFIKERGSLHCATINFYEEAK
jgi:agmatine/peptidylarginine deiminase